MPQVLGGNVDVVAVLLAPKVVVRAAICHVAVQRLASVLVCLVRCMLISDVSGAQYGMRQCRCSYTSQVRLQRVRTLALSQTTPSDSTGQMFTMYLVCAQPWHELTHRSANTGNLCASSQQGSIAPPPLHTDCSLLSPPMQLVPVVS